MSIENNLRKKGFKFKSIEAHMGKILRAPSLGRNLLVLIEGVYSMPCPRAPTSAPLLKIGIMGNTHILKQLHSTPPQASDFRKSQQLCQQLSSLKSEILSKSEASYRNS